MPRSSPDHIVTPTADIESRMGIQPLEELLAERDVLVKEVAVMRAKHAPFGTYDALRKIQLSAIATGIRAEATAKNEKKTEACVSDEAHAHDTYVAFVLDATREKAEWIQKENAIQGIEDRINRDQAVARFVAAEVHLA